MNTTDSIQLSSPCNGAIGVVVPTQREIEEWEKLRQQEEKKSSKTPIVQFFSDEEAFDLSFIDSMGRIH